MEGGFQCRAGAALARPSHVAALQIGPGTERSSCTCYDKAADFGLFVLDSIKRVAEAAEHVDRYRVHYLLVIQLQDSDRTVDIERGMLELHGFLIGYELLF